MGEEVSAPAKDIQMSAKTISGLKGDLKTPQDGLGQIDVQPGDFQEGNDLKDVVNKRKDEAIALVNAVGKELDDISTKMGKNADNIQTTEDENQWKAEGVKVPKASK